MISNRQFLFLLVLGMLAWPQVSNAQDPVSVLPQPVTEESFSELKARSPFSRTLSLSKSLILTGVAQIGEETVATMLDLETRESFVVSEETNPDGMQLVEMRGDQTDVGSLTAKIKIGGVDIVSIRYEKPPPTVRGNIGVRVSTRVGNGTAGGGTEPHGGPDPRVLTRDQMADAKNGAMNIRGGFKADGYGDNEKVPDAVVSKLSRLSVQQRESVNVRMYEYRNKGLGMEERQKIYNRMLDSEIKKK